MPTPSPQLQSASIERRLRDDAHARLAQTHETHALVSRITSAIAAENPAPAQHPRAVPLTPLLALAAAIILCVSALVFFTNNRKPHASAGAAISNALNTLPSPDRLARSAPRRERSMRGAVISIPDVLGLRAVLPSGSTNRT